jgi:hypothetical protein
MQSMSAAAVDAIMSITVTSITSMSTSMDIVITIMIMTGKGVAVKREQNTLTRKKSSYI